MAARITVTVSTIDGMQPTLGWATDTPGLVVTSHRSSEYAVTHVRSGCAIPGTCRTLKAALYLADMLRECADWEQDALALMPVRDIPGVCDCIQFAATSEARNTGPVR